MHTRTLTPGAWVLGAAISPDGLFAPDSPRVRITASGGAAIVEAFAPLIESCKRAERAAFPVRIARDECHHCGAPSPGSICRYCNTEHRRTTTP